MNNNKVVNNMFWLIGFQIIKAIIGFVIGIFTARFLGPSNYGIIGYISTFILIFTPISNLGLGDVIVKEYVQKKEQTSSILKTAIIMNIAMSLFSYVVINTIIFVTNINDKTMLYCSLVQTLLLIFNSFEMVTYYFQSQLKSKKTVILTFVSYIITQTFKILILIFDGSIVLFALASSLDTIVTGVLLFILAKSTKELRGGKFSFDIVKCLIKQSAPFILSGCLSVIYASVDKIMLKGMLGDTENVGYYTIAHGLATCWVFVVSATISSFKPVIYEAFDSDNATYKTRLRQLYWLVFYFGGFISLCLSLVVPFAIPILYTEVYKSAILPTILLTWASVFAYLGVARGVQIVCEKKQKYMVGFYGIAVVLNIILNAVLIPIWGVTGVALATLISEMFVCLVCPLFFKETRAMGLTMLRAIICSGVDIKYIFKTLLLNFKKKKDNEEVSESAGSGVVVSCVEELIDNDENTKEEEVL